jgi:hypothetical protein
MKPIPSVHSARVHLIVAHCSLLCLATVAWAQQATITLDDVNASTNTVVFAPADHYRSLGAVFTRDFPVYELGRIEPTFRPSWLAAGGTQSNAMPLTTTFDPRLSIDMTFVLPGTLTRATTDYVRALFGDGNLGTSIGTLEAFDLSGTLVASATATTPTTFWLPLEVSAPRIARVRFTVDVDGGAIDNITFNTPTNAAVPVMAIRVSEVELCWNSISNKMYQVQYRSELTTNAWTALGAPVQGNGSTNCVTDAVQLGQPQRLYRVEELP